MSANSSSGAVPFPESAQASGLLQIAYQPKTAEPAARRTGEPRINYGFRPDELHERIAELFELGPQPSEAPRPRKPLVLLATTTRWIASARQALAFAEAGFAVEAVCPSGHPFTQLDFVRRRHRLEVLDPLRSIRRAVELCAPDLIVPCDDRMVGRLHQLYDATGVDPAAERLRALLVRSLGEPEYFAEVRSRAALMELAAEEGVLRPETTAVFREEDLASWLAEVGFPAVLKTDGSWGGQGVRVVRDFTEARRAFRRLLQGPSPSFAAKQLLLERDLHFAAAALRRARPAISVQQYVRGRPASAAAACWRGDLLSLLCVEAVRTTRPRGHASVVRTLDHPEMFDTVARMVRRLGLSGLCGFDFVLDNAGRAWLIELNARTTPICHLAGWDGIDPAEALCERLGGPERRRRRSRTPGEIIALFPQEMARNPTSELLLFAWHDVPSRHPEFVRLGLQAVGRERWRRTLRRLAGRQPGGA